MRDKPDKSGLSPKVILPYFFFFAVVFLVPQVELFFPGLQAILEASFPIRFIRGSNIAS